MGHDAVEAIVDHLFRSRASQITAVLTRIFGLDNLDLVEDVVQDALIAALTRWPHAGVPQNPGAWIVRVARNRALDQLRRRSNWRGKETSVRQTMEVLARIDDAEGGFAAEIRDDQLAMIFACCHEVLPRDAQVALTLKTVMAFSVDEIARAFLAQPATVAQRLVRAKRRLRTASVPLELPAPHALPARLDAVLEVVYLLFNEGYSATTGTELVRHDLCAEAWRLVSMLADAPMTAGPRTDAVAALIAFQSARAATRIGQDGVLLPLDQQDRGAWDRRMIAVGFGHLARAAQGTSLSRYHLEAEIAAHHVAAERHEDTDWRRILDGYDTLMTLHPTPIVALNRAVAVAEVHGAEAGLEALEPLIESADLARYPLLWSTRGALLARLGRSHDANRDFIRARTLSLNDPAARFLDRKIDGDSSTPNR